MMHRQRYKCAVGMRVVSVVGMKMAGRLLSNLGVASMRSGRHSRIDGRNDKQRDREPKPDNRDFIESSQADLSHTVFLNQ